ncbi:MAG: hypothetical protein WA294_06100 [Acidobacteriaceae bacterium]
MKLKITVKGRAVSETNITPKTDITSFKDDLKCSKVKNEFTEYENGEGKTVKGILEINFGLGFEQSCEQENEEVALSSSKMFAVS